jgi:hypothetical protein
MTASTKVFFNAQRLAGVLSLLFFALFALAGAASAATVRGRLTRPGLRGAQQPAAGITVTVFNRSLNRRSSPVVTDQNGMYVLGNISAGDCYLEVWSRDPHAPPRQYQIHVVEPLTDIGPVVVP